MPEKCLLVTGSLRIPRHCECKVQRERHATVLAAARGRAFAQAARARAFALQARERGWIAEDLT